MSSNAAEKRRYRARTGSGTAARSNHPWSPDDDDRVLAQDVTDRTLAAQIGRSVQAIQSRRVILRGWEPSELPETLIRGIAPAGPPADGERHARSLQEGAAR